MFKSSYRRGQVTYVFYEIASTFLLNFLQSVKSSTDRAGSSLRCSRVVVVSIGILPIFTKALYELSSCRSCERDRRAIRDLDVSDAVLELGIGVGNIPYSLQ